ncbi:MAG: hypothetical protein MJ252_13605, partial [archaeon]|nr:hypothetical protein [archaeon]
MKLYNLLKFVFLLELTLTPHFGVSMSLLNSEDSNSKEKTELIEGAADFEKELKEIESQNQKGKINIESLKKEFLGGKEGEESTENPRFVEEENISNNYTDNVEITENYARVGAGEEFNRIIGRSATAQTTYRWSFWFWRRYQYEAHKVLRGHSGYWRSKNWRKSDYIEITFNPNGDELTKISVINFTWRSAPSSFQIFFKTERNGKYIPCTNKYIKYQYMTNGVVNNKKYVSNRNSVRFYNPIRASHILIKLFDPINGSYFAIDEIDTFNVFSTILIKNSEANSCFDLCWTVLGGGGAPIVAYPCKKVIQLGAKLEIFRETKWGNLVFDNQCVGFNGAGEISTYDCRYTNFQFKVAKDNSIYFKGYPNKCIAIDLSEEEKINYVDSRTEIIASSEFDFNYKGLNLKVSGESEWSSSPGDKRVSLQIIFGKNIWGGMDKKLVDFILIEWIREPKEFTIYSWIEHQSWVPIKTIKDNTSKRTYLKLKGLMIHGIMLVLQQSDGSKDLGNLPVYGIKNIHIGANAYRLKYVECNSVGSKAKTWILEPQTNLDFSKTQGAMNDINKISTEYSKTVKVFRNLLSQWMMNPVLKERAEKLNNELTKYNKMENELYSKILAFTSESLTYRGNEAFEEIKKNIRNLNKKKDEEETPTHLGQLGSESNPGESCLALKSAIRGISDGYYYIKPECGEEALRVYCDFSSRGIQAADYYVIGEANQDLSYLGLMDINGIRAECGRVGLEPIEIKNGDMITTINNILVFYGFNLAKQMVVPLGVDYGCINKKNCQNDYRSMNRNNADRIFKYFKKAANDRTPPKEMIGLGYSDKLISKRFSFTDGEKFAALICSTNKFTKGKKEIPTKSISCGLTIKKNPHLFGRSGISLAVCPKNCESNSGVLNGKGRYDFSNSICLAAINEGVISQEEGGKFKIHLTKNDFSVLKYEPTCPYKESSFMEVSNYGLFDTISKAKDKVSSTVDKATNTVNQAVNQASNAANEAVNQASNAANQVANQASNTVNEVANQASNAASSAGNELENLTKQASNLSNSLVNSAQNALNNVADKVLSPSLNAIKEHDDEVNQAIKSIENNSEENPQPDENNSNEVNPLETEGEPKEPCVDCDEAEQPDEDEKCSKTTTEIISELTENLKENYIKLIEDINVKFSLMTLKMDKMKKEFSWKDSQTLKIQALRNKIKSFNALKKTAAKEFQGINVLSQVRIESAKKILEMLNKKYESLNEGGNSNGLFDSKDFDFNKLFTIFSLINAKSSSFSLMETNNQHITKAIGNTFDPKYKESRGTLMDMMYFFKYGKYYNFQVSTNIYLRNDKGNSGIAFRINTPFNFYALDFNKKKGTLSLFKVMQGKYTLLNDIKNAD